MNFKIYVIGKIKNKDHLSAIKEYQKRLSRYCKITLIEVKDESSLISKLGSSHVVRINTSDETISSEALAEKINDWGVSGKSDVSFVYSNESLTHNESFAITPVDLTIGMFAIAMHEQIYRGFRILRNEPYHK